MASAICSSRSRLERRKSKKSTTSWQGVEETQQFNQQSSNLALCDAILSKPSSSYLLLCSPGTEAERPRQQYLDTQRCGHVASATCPLMIFGMNRAIWESVLTEETWILGRPATSIRVSVLKRSVRTYMDLYRFQIRSTRVADGQVGPNLEQHQPHHVCNRALRRYVPAPSFCGHACNCLGYSAQQTHFKADKCINILSEFHHTREVTLTGLGSFSSFMEREFDPQSVVCWNDY